MIPMKLQIILLVISVCGLIFLINRIVKYKLELKYSLLWLFLNVVTIVLSVVPQVSINLAKWFGIETPVNVLFLLGILLSLTIMFTLTVALSRHTVKIKLLTQELGLAKNEMKQMQQRLDELLQK